jgi:hypothetical protein
MDIEIENAKLKIEKSEALACRSFNFQFSIFHSAEGRRR